MKTTSTKQAAAAVPLKRRKSNHLQQGRVPPEIIQSLRNRYEQFDAALQFVIRHRLPACKCEVLAMPSHGSHEGECYGYTNCREHVAAAVCAVLEAEAQGEEEWEIKDLNILREHGTVYLRLEHWDLVWFRPLTRYEISRLRAEYRKARHRRYWDPFESELELYPFMPGGDLNPY